MTEERTFHVSVVEPIEPAIEKVKTILFSPFDFNRWFVIGFCAWLAYLGGGGFNFNFGPRFRFPFGKQQGDEQLFDRIHDFVINNLPLVITIGTIVLVIVIAIGIILSWLSSRGQFMFLDCVAKNKTVVKEPWRAFRVQGNSLFLFRLVVGIISFVCLIFCVGIAVLVVIAMKMYGIKMIIMMVPLLVFIVLVFILLLIAIGVVLKFTLDFVVPIMYLRGCTCMEGWRQFLPILSNNKGSFTLYILFQIVIGMAIGIIIIAAVCLTCCIACCILIIPYIGTVLILPLLIFQRAYSLMYLRQYGPALDVFATV